MKSQQYKILDLSSQYHSNLISEYEFIEQVDELVLNAHSELLPYEMIELLSNEYNVPKKALNQLHLNGLLQGMKIGKM